MAGYPFFSLFPNLVCNRIFFSFEGIFYFVVTVVSVYK